MGSGCGGAGFVGVCLNGSMVAGGEEIEKGNGWWRVREQLVRVRAARWRGK